MALTCWKWHDMSVANTISTTRALNSLRKKTHSLFKLSLSLSPQQTLAELLRCCTSSHLWTGCRGCSSRRRPVGGDTLRWRGGSPAPSGRCTGSPCLTWTAETHTGSYMLTSMCIISQFQLEFKTSPGGPLGGATEIMTWCVSRKGLLAKTHITMVIWVMVWSTWLV